MTTSKLVKTIVLIVLLIAASSYLGYTSLQTRQLGDTIFSPTMDTLYSFIWLLLALLSVAITAGLVAALVRPLWICFIAFAISSSALLFFWGHNLISIALVVSYFLAGLLYSRGVARGLDERIKFSVRPIRDNQTVLIMVLIIAVCALFYFSYAAQIERDGFTTPSFVTDIGTGIAEKQIEEVPGLTPQEREQALAEFKQEFEQQVQEAIKPYQKFIPPGIAVILLGLLMTVIGLFAWLPPLILRGIFAILTACHVTTVVAEMQETKRLIID
jgi:hypothetical protein